MKTFKEFLNESNRLFKPGLDAIKSITKSAVDVEITFTGSGYEHKLKMKNVGGKNGYYQFEYSGPKNIKYLDVLGLNPDAREGWQRDISVRATKGRWKAVVDMINSQFIVTDIKEIG